MQDRIKQEERWPFNPVVEFGAQLIAATFIFVMILGAAVGISLLVTWLESQKIDPVLVMTFNLLKYVVVGIDVLVYVVFLLGEGWRAIRTMVVRYWG